MIVNFCIAPTKHAIEVATRRLSGELSLKCRENAAPAGPEGHVPFSVDQVAVALNSPHKPALADRLRWKCFLFAGTQLFHSPAGKTLDLSVLICGYDIQLSDSLMGVTAAQSHQW